MKAAAQALYDLVDKVWSASLSMPMSPLKAFIDLFWSDCAYCTAYRAFAVGLGIGLFIGGGLIPALICVLLVVILVLLERIVKGGASSDSGG